MALNSGKKKKSILRRILKWSGIGLLLLIIGIILVPIFFKDELKQLVLDEANKTLNAKLELDDFDLTFLSTFPSLAVQLDGVRVKGVDTFENVTLASIKHLRANVGLWDVISGDQIAVKSIQLTEPQFDVRILKDGRANYDIVKPDSTMTPEQASEPSAFKMSLQSYSIENGTIRYDDRASDMFAEIINLNHTGKGDLTAEEIDFETVTTMDELTFDMGGLSYLSKVKTDVVANLFMELKEDMSKFTLRDNQFKLNALSFGLEGFYAMHQGYDDMDLKMNAKQAKFKEFLSLIPAFYQSGYESMVADGSLALNGLVKGKMDDKNMPGWDFGMQVKNASIKYPDLPGKITNIQIDAGSKFAGGSNMDAMTVDVNKFHADFAGNTLDANLKMRNPMTDPSIKSDILAKVDLATLKQVMPMAEGESYNGKLDADVHLNGRMSALEKEDYEAFEAQGTAILSDMHYTSPDLTQPLDIKSMTLGFSPRNLTLQDLDVKTGKSDFQMEGTIDNYMGYVFRDELLRGKFNFTSNNLDLDELMNITPPSESAELPETASETTASEEPFLLPDNVDFDLNTQIGNTRYNGIDVKNINGRVSIKEEVATLHDLTMNTLGGQVGLRGSYSTLDHNKPSADFGYSLKELDIQQLAKNFLTIEKLAPIAKYAQGKISSTLNLKTDLTPNLDPILNSLNGDGDLFSNMVTISGFKPLDKMAEVTQLNKLSNQTIRDLKTWFSFSNGEVKVKPFNVNLGNIKSSVEGKTGFDQSMDYDLTMMVPKSEIPASLLKAAEQAIAKLNNLAPKLNLASLPEQIPVTVKMLGTVSQPKITTNFKEAIMKASGNVKDQLIDNLVNTAKDSVKTIVNDKINEVKDDLNERKQKILDDAKREADKIRAQAKKANAEAHAQADKAYNEAVAAAGSNPLKKKAAEVAAGKVRDEAYKKADQAEAEANKQADGILSRAQAEADKLK